ncbi:MAG: pyridoxal-phosphate dependent enzyme [Bacteroidota bacterium]|nr:pyridoxal-phosphate dependent enzyme [Bacteroidota bacterium]
MIQIPDFSDIENASKQIAQFVHKTPVLSSNLINEIAGCNIVFKCENFQKVGAFKFRGATNAIQNLSKKELAKGVCTHSSGNHAQALSLAAKQAGIPAYIVMPNNAPQVKIDAVRNYNAEIFFCEPTLEARERKLNEIQKITGASFIHPYNNFHVIAGQGTAAKELLEDVSDLDAIIAPVGGGGLMSGTAITTKSIYPAIRIYGAEPKAADDAKRSLDAGKLIPSLSPKTMADGLLTSLSDGTFHVLNTHLNDILTCSEKSIVLAMQYLYERMKIVVEPSGAVPLACILENSTLFKNQRIGIIISGGNVDVQRLPF